MSLHVERLGDGPDLVLLHGWGMHSGVWHGMAERLAQYCRLHLVDLPGMGYSDACTPYTLPRLAQVLSEAMPTRASVCGWSFGGQVAMQLALDHPAQISRLVLVGSTPRFVNGGGWQHGVDAEVFKEFAAQVAEDYPATMERFLGLQAFGGESSRSLLRELRQRFSARPAPRPQVLQQALHILLENDMRERCSDLRLPLQIIHGQRDTLAPAAAARWMAVTCPQARLDLISGASHAPFLSHPSVFEAALRKFLEQPAYAG